MLDVVIALLPVVVMSIVLFRLDAVRNIGVSVLCMELCEIAFLIIKNKVPYDGKKHTFKEHWLSIKKAITPNTFLVPLVSALIFAMIMPAKTNPSGMIYAALITGSIFGLVVGKLVFGGTGKNIFNPAAVGMLFSKLCFGSTYQYPTSPLFSSTDSVTTGATALSGGTYSLLDMFLGKVPGVIGEVCKVAILVGLAYLIVRHTIDWRIPLAYIGIFAIDMLVVGFISKAGDSSINPLTYMTSQLLTGGLLFGATFMATDPVTSSITRPGRFMYGALLAGLTVLIRLFAPIPEGVVFAILLGNIATCAIDYYKWSNNKFSWKNILWIVSIAIVPLVICIWVKCVEVF